MTELRQFHDKTWMNEELLLMYEWKKQSLLKESTPDYEAVKMVEMKTKDLEYYINLVDKATAEFYRIESGFTVGKIL